MKKRPPYNQNAAIRGALRRAFARSPLVQEKMNESRREVPKYKKDGTLAKKPHVQRQCEVCQQWVGSSHMAVDHIDPVISVDSGFVDWNEFVDRLWCNATGKDNLQRICDPCHDKKTAQERYQRMYGEELEKVAAIESAVMLPEDAKKFLKKFNKKRLDKYPYPQEFKDRVVALRRHMGMRV